MKKVRFETPEKGSQLNLMDNSDCHSPRPYMKNSIGSTILPVYDYPQILPFSNDPMERFECSNSSPYPVVNKTSLSNCNNSEAFWLPSNDLDLSMLEHHEPRKPVFYKSILKDDKSESCSKTALGQTNVLSSLNDKQSYSPNNFFIRRDNVDKLQISINSPERFVKLSSGKENNPYLEKTKLMRTKECGPKTDFNKPSVMQIGSDCNCHHCVIVSRLPCTVTNTKTNVCSSNQISIKPSLVCMQCQVVSSQLAKRCSCNFKEPCTESNADHKDCACINKLNQTNLIPQNAVDKKAWMVQRYKKNKQSECMEVEKQTNIITDKREPTVSDLFKIIKLQNEQLQLLQDKVDKFISVNTKPEIQPTKKYVEHVSLETVNNEQHKISIGVMTSFEMVRTSTVINKEANTQGQNAQIQCNRSQISIKEVVSKAPVNLNFLEGIAPVDTSGASNKNNEEQIESNNDKTLNEYSLFNVQVDNATTPLISPEQTMYLDIRDYSESEPGDDADKSNVGWTYYNKVMTHVNGMLQDSDIPSSASAMYRNAQQHCVQLQVDKTNLSVTKRVKFGDDPLGIHQPHIYATPTDTSLKMNQLAAKYLKSEQVLYQQLPKSAALNCDLSLATQNYMERHKLTRRTVKPLPSIQQPVKEMPKFLDITTLKQQPKLL